MKKIDPKKKRGLAPRSLVQDEARRSALASLDRPGSPAAAFVRAALEAAEPRSSRTVELARPKEARPRALEASVATLSVSCSEPAAPSAEPARESPAVAPAPREERVLRRVPLGEIDLGSRRFQYRVSRSLARLQESLLLTGQQVPVILRGAQPPYEIVSGFGRCDAIASLAVQGKIPEPTLWADHRPSLTDREAHEISVIENEEREGLTELDRTSKAKKLKDEGYSISEIATVLKKGERMVQYYLSLAQAPAVIGSALERGAIRPTHALVLTKFAREALAELTPGEIEGRLQELLRHCEKGASVAQIKASLSPRAEPRRLLERPEGFELKGFHYRKALAEDERKRLLAVLDEARERIARDLSSA